MADEPRVIQPIVTMPPPYDPSTAVAATEEEAARFVEDTEVDTSLTFTEWVASRRPIPVPEPTSEIADDGPDI